MRDLRALIADDQHAATFQSLGQYRTALLSEIDAAAPQAAQGAIHQFRQKGCTDWYDMTSAEQEQVVGDSAFEIRTVYTYPPPQDAEDAEDAEDAARYRRLFEGPYPFCFNGETYNEKAQADAAIDAARAGEGDG